jgi:hypothetical protein
MSDSVKKWHEMNAEWLEPRYVQKKEDTIVTKIINKFKQRSEDGIREYGTTLADNPDGFYKWIDEAQSEAMDFILYLEKIKNLNK